MNIVLQMKIYSLRRLNEDLQNYPSSRIANNNYYEAPEPVERNANADITIKDIQSIIDDEFQKSFDGKHILQYKIFA